MYVIQRDKRFWTGFEWTSDLLEAKGYLRANEAYTARSRLAANNRGLVVRRVHITLEAAA